MIMKENINPTRTVFNTILLKYYIFYYTNLDYSINSTKSNSIMNSSGMDWSDLVSTIL